MRIFKRLIVSVISIFICAIIGLYVYTYNNYVTPIIMYHSVSDTYSGPPTVSVKNFEKQIHYLSEHKYNVISLDEFVEGNINNKKFSRNTVIITFDDGFKDNYIYAYPILKKYQMPATIFIISDFIGKKPEHLDWRQVNEMLKENISFGAHTKNHACLPTLNQDIAYQEIKNSKEQIETNLGQKIMFFSYPGGAFNENIKKIVKDAGFKAACTTNRGFDKKNRDIFELKRIKITDKDSDNFINFRMKLSGYYNIFRRTKNPC